MCPAERVTAVPDLAEILRQVRRLELRTRRLVNSRFSGEYHSVFKGQGIEFAEVREYLPGDDVRTIDWNVTARLGTPYVKKYVEERELTVLLAVDLSGSQAWGTERRFKTELAAEVAATLGMSAIRNNDRVGLLAFTDRIEAFVRPRKGRRHVLRLLRDLLVLEPEGRGTDLVAALRYTSRVLSTRAIVFLFSDFQVGSGWERFERAMSLLAARHDLIAVILSDPRESSLPPVGLLRLRDPESGATFAIDTGRAGVRERWAAVHQEQEQLRRLLRRLRVDAVELRTDQPSTPALLSFFRRRERRLRR